MCTPIGYVLRPPASAANERWSGGNIRGGCRRFQGLRHSLILVHVRRAGEASRVLHPSRSCASGCSANGRSATRPDSQRSRRRTRWDGHPAWGWKPRPSCLPSRAVHQPTTATGRRTAAAMLRPRVVIVRNARAATTARAFLFARKHERHERLRGRLQIASCFRAFVLSCFRAFVLSCFRGRQWTGTPEAGGILWPAQTQTPAR